MLDSKNTRSILPVHVINPLQDTEKAIHVGEELESLIATLGVQVTGRVIQKLDRSNISTYIGKGKVEEVALKIKEKQIDVVSAQCDGKAASGLCIKKTTTKDQTGYRSLGQSRSYTAYF